MLDQILYSRCAVGRHLGNGTPDGHSDGLKVFSLSEQLTSRWGGSLSAAQVESIISNRVIWTIYDNEGIGAYTYCVLDDDTRMLTRSWEFYPFKEGRSEFTSQSIIGDISYNPACAMESSVWITDEQQRAMTGMSAVWFRANQNGSDTQSNAAQVPKYLPQLYDDLPQGIDISDVIERLPESRIPLVLSCVLFLIDNLRLAPDKRMSLAIITPVVNGQGTGPNTSLPAESLRVAAGKAQAVAALICACLPDEISARLPFAVNTGTGIMDNATENRGRRFQLLVTPCEDFKKGNGIVKVNWDTDSSCSNVENAHAGSAYCQWLNAMLHGDPAMLNGFYNRFLARLDFNSPDFELYELAELYDNLLLKGGGDIQEQQALRYMELLGRYDGKLAFLNQTRAMAERAYANYSSHVAQDAVNGFAMLKDAEYKLTKLNLSDDCLSDALASYLSELLAQRIDPSLNLETVLSNIDALSAMGPLYEETLVKAFADKEPIIRMIRNGRPDAVLPILEFCERVSSYDGAVVSDEDVDSIRSSGLYCILTSNDQALLSRLLDRYSVSGASIEALLTDFRSRFMPESNRMSCLLGEAACALCRADPRPNIRYLSYVNATVPDETVNVLMQWRGLKWASVFSAAATSLSAEYVNEFVKRSFQRKSIHEIARMLDDACGLKSMLPKSSEAYEILMEHACRRLDAIPYTGDYSELLTASMKLHGTFGIKSVHPALRTFSMLHAVDTYGMYPDKLLNAVNTFPLERDLNRGKSVLIVIRDFDSTQKLDSYMQVLLNLIRNNIVKMEKTGITRVFSRDPNDYEKYVMIHNLYLNVFDFLYENIILREAKKWFGAYIGMIVSTGNDSALAALMYMISAHLLREYGCAVTETECNWEFFYSEIKRLLKVGSLNERRLKKVIDLLRLYVPVEDDNREEFINSLVEQPKRSGSGSERSARHVQTVESFETAGASVRNSKSVLKKLIGLFRRRGSDKRGDK